MPKRIYVADDEKDICQLINVFLTNAGYQVKTFATGDDLWRAFCETPADLVILDVMMPGTDGLALCAQLRKRSKVPIIIVSAKTTEFDRVMGLTMGSDDYLTKPFSLMELVARVHRIFRRNSCRRELSDFTYLHFGDIFVNTKEEQAFIKGESLNLTSLEYDFLVYMLNRSEQAVSREELLKNVWEMEFEVSVRTTDSLVKRLRKKLAQSKSVVQIATVRGIGFHFTYVSAEDNLTCKKED